MTEDISASVVTLHQPQPKKVKTPAERARAYRERKKAAVVLSSDSPMPAPMLPATVVTYARSGTSTEPLVVTSRRVTSRTCC